MNWLSWLPPMNSRTAPSTSLAFISWVGTICSGSRTAIRSRTPFSIRANPTRTWPCNNSPTVFTRRLPR